MYGSLGVGVNEKNKKGGSPDGGAGGGAIGLHSYSKPSGGRSGYVFASLTQSDYPNGCSLDSSYYLENTETRRGNASFPNAEGNGNKIGHSGNSAAKIALLIE